MAEELDTWENLIQEKSLFNIPFWGIRIINFEEKKKELVKLLESYPEEKKGLQEFATNRPTDRSGLVEQFGSIMNQELKAFTKEIKKDFAIVEIWSVSYAQGDSQSAHNHSSMGLSGILYLDLPKDSPETTYIQPWTDHETDTVRHVEVPIAEGVIVIVPSFVLHFSKPNKSNSKKRIISWDMKILNERKYRKNET